MWLSLVIYRYACMVMEDFANIYVCICMDASICMYGNVCIYVKVFVHVCMYA